MIILELKADDGVHEKAGAHSVSVVFVGQLTAGSDHVQAATDTVHTD